VGSSRSSAALLRATAFWERLRASKLLKGSFLFACVAVVVLALSLLPAPQESPLADAERFAFDQQMRYLQSERPRPLPNDIVLVGTDEQTLKEWDEPIALWHRRFAGVLHALAKAKPLAVGVDFVLPERSFDKISPGIDLAMMRGLLDLRRSTRLVYVQAVNAEGKLIAVQPNYRNIIQEENLGVDQHLRDPDGVSRRFGHLAGDDGEEIPSLVSQLLRALKQPMDQGYIDYSIGAPLEYVPIHEIAAWDEAMLRKRFEGRVVMIGSLVQFVDRWRLPTKLLAVDPGRPRSVVAAADPQNYIQPGVLIHAQAMRSHLASGLLHPAPPWAQWALMALAALAVFVRARAASVVVAAVVFPMALLVTSLYMIEHTQILLPVMSILASLWGALIFRGVFDAVAAVVERVRLQQSFAGQVSPAVMQEMLGGNLTPGVSGQLAEVCVLFSDVRDFTTLSENMPPAVVTTVLQRYFDRMVHAVHKYDGTVDKFIGDGMMILFGAPRKSTDPCGDAVQCALAMMAELDQLNLDFEREGLPTLTIGIGINYGTVTAGMIGSSERHNYSAIGDAVNVAARLEGLTKELGRKIVITDAVVQRIGQRFHFDALGSHKVKGHSPVNVWGIRTARVAPSVVEAEAVQ
jgi:adenylate cyclase